jgi:hypothetical protein
MNVPDFKELCYQYRERLKPFDSIRRLVDHPGIPDESKANVMLAFRALEDCRMRLGKAIEAYDGGASVYPR